MPKAPLVLIVEDDDSIRNALIELIYEEGYNAHGARDGREALEYLQSPESLRPALILLDLLMPEISGWEVLSSMRGDEYMSSIPVCAISGAAVVSPQGVVKFMRKPLNMDMLLDVVRRHCGQQGDAALRD